MAKSLSILIFTTTTDLNIIYIERVKYLMYGSKFAESFCDRQTRI